MPTCLLAALFALLVWSAPAGAQQRVDCGNGAWCPSDHACLLGGMCGRKTAGPPGGIKLPNGLFCDPGYSVSRVIANRCVPPNYSECSSGTMCPPGRACGADGRCTGGPPATGPACGDGRCAEDRVCASTGRCMNPQLFHDCGNGGICTHAAACEMPSGCVYVAPTRIPQTRW